MLKVGWLCLDGTNTWKTNSSLGANLIIRQPLLQRFLDIGARVEWYGLKETSNLIEDVEYSNLRPNIQVKDLVNSAFRKYDKEWKAKKPKEQAKLGSMSKWICENTIEYALMYLKLHPLPKVDFLFAEYMDNGMGQICYFTTILVYYAMQGVPLYVRDTERRFRYNSEISKVVETPRKTIYEHRLQRYISQDHVNAIRGRIRMVYPYHSEDWDNGTRGFYKTPAAFMPIVYERNRELQLPSVKHRVHPVVYIGNDNNRREMFEMWYGALKQRAFIYGNWRKRAGGDAYVESWKTINPLVTFAPDPIPVHLVLGGLQRASCSVVVYPKHYVTLGQITDRMAELAQAGTIAIAPRELWNAEEWALPQFIVRDTDHMNTVIEDILTYDDGTYREAAYEQRKLLREHFNGDLVFNDFVSILQKDGVKVWDSIQNVAT